MEATIQLFQKIFMLCIKLKRMMPAVPVDIYSTPGMVSNSQMIFFSESSYVAFQIKENGA